MYTFRDGVLIGKNEKIKLVKLYKQIKKVLEENSNKSDELRDALENLLIETFTEAPGILYVLEQEENKCIIDLIVEYKYWGALFELAKKHEFADMINEKLLNAKSKKNLDNIK